MTPLHFSQHDRPNYLPDGSCLGAMIEEARRSAIGPGRNAP